MLAERNDGVVINADSAQGYRDLRVVTARPSPADEARVPHRLFGHVDAADTGHNAARWAGEARAAVAEVQAAGQLPILVGGTGLYLRPLLDGIAPVPAIDPGIRAAVRATTVDEAHRQLAALDPPAAAALHVNDTARVHRALEVVRSTGQPIARWRNRREGGIGGHVRLAAAVLLPSRGWLEERIARRGAAIVRDGVAEIAALLARPDVPPDAPPRRAIGVSEMTRLVRGEASAAEAEAALLLATRRYAKRQYTWFSRQPPPDWQRTDLTDPTVLMSIVETMLRR